MTKGREGESCAEAIRDCVNPGERLSFDDIYRRVRPRGYWTNETIYQNLMKAAVNLAPARLRWPGSKPFLLLMDDGTYVLHDPKTHPPVAEPRIQPGFRPHLRIQ